MYGLAAIDQANGWAMAMVGGLIVLIGLSTLSFLISQLHRIINLFSKKIKPTRNHFTERISVDILDDSKKISSMYISITKQLGDKFYLTDLYRISKKIKLPHPYISIRNFRNSKILISKGNGYFSWK